MSNSSLTTGQMAIRIDRLCLSYQTDRPILRDFSMEVPRGNIFGLLGPSGCGKTSLIRCLLGTNNFDSGRVQVFGRRPGSRHSHVPGRAVGYMPQDICLQGELTIAETLRYFATLYDLEPSQVGERIHFLIYFLALPDPSRQVATLSGGQKRRVSLATALIHKPPLLLLDEPTVGVDPLLRQAIWRYLRQLVESDAMTVLITTHYIEEANGAHLVGLMRNGRLLIQDDPGKLTQRYQMATLENVFLKLCNQQDGKDGEILNEVTSSVDSESVSSDFPDSPSYEELIVSVETVAPHEPSSTGHYFKQMGAMLSKNLSVMRRSPGFMLFQLLLPTIQVILFCACIGRDLRNIPVSIYNGDISNVTEGMVRALTNTDTFYPLQCMSQEKALDMVRSGEAATAITINRHFTDSLHERLMLLGDVDEVTLNHSTIHIHPDMSNHIMVLTVYETVIEAFQEVAGDYLDEIGSNRALVDFPIRLAEPIYGSHNSSFTEFMAPGVILSIAFLAAVPLTAMTIVGERKHGLIERSLVAGASTLQLLFSHFMAQGLVLLGQAALLMVCVFPIFQIPYHGEFGLILLMTVLQSVCGMSFGLLVSAVTQQENTATMLALGSFYPNLLLSGTVWPTEAMHTYLRYFSYLLPQTLPIDAMRAMISRGWGLAHFEVQLGFIVTILWINIFLFTAALIFRFSRL